MHHFLLRLGRGAARYHWVVIVAWLLIVVRLVLARDAAGGRYANSYSVPGSSSQQGLDLLTAQFPAQAGYAGQIVYAGQSVTAQADAVNLPLVGLEEGDEEPAGVPQTVAAR